MAVGGRTRDRLGGDFPLGTRAVLDDEGLPEALGEPLADQAREDVGRAAGRKANDDAHRSRRIGLRPGDLRYRRQYGSTDDEVKECAAGKSHDDPDVALLSQDYQGIATSSRALQRAQSAGLIAVETLVGAGLKPAPTRMTRT